MYADVNGNPSAYNKIWNFMEQNKQLSYKFYDDYQLTNDGISRKNNIARILSNMTDYKELGVVILDIPEFSSFTFYQFLVLQKFILNKFDDEILKYIISVIGVLSSLTYGYGIPYHEMYKEISRKSIIFTLDGKIINIMGKSDK